MELFCRYLVLLPMITFHLAAVKRFALLIIIMICFHHSEGGIIPNVPASILGQIENLLNRIKAVSPQHELDGIKNIWIVKPGAKSRGRGKH